MGSIGEFEQLVLLSLFRVGKDAYGVPIWREIVDRTGRSVSLGAVYKTLERLEDKGFVGSREGMPTPERGGRSKRCFRLLALGERALQESASTSRRIVDAFEEGWSGRWKPRRLK